MFIVLFIISISTRCNTPASRQPEVDTPVQEIIVFKSGDVALEGVLNLPPSNEKVPLVVFVHGSGRATRDDYSEVSATLNKHGFATFRYDKRGVGRSGGSFIEVSTWNSNDRIELLASDAAAAIKQLSSHDQIDRQRLIVIGGSQAGWIIPVVCGLVDVSSAVCISGPAVSVGEEIYYSELAENHLHTQENADKLLGEFQGPNGFDNVQFIVRMSNPSLWIFGGKDVSIPVKRCIARLDSVKNAGGLPVDVRIYPEADHGVYNQQLGRLEDYVTAIVEWLSGR